MSVEFRVTNFFFNRPNCVVWIENRNLDKVDLELNTDRFELWLLTQNKLKWKVEYREGVYRSEELEGTMSYQEYWSQDMNVICSDIHEVLRSQTGNYYQIKINKLKTTKNG